MTSKNDITGDSIATKATTDAYRNNYDAIFGKKPKTREAETVDCWCHKCIEGKTDAMGIPLSMTTFVVCRECGHKRCPKATDHQLDCTNSNAPGQPGSCY